MAIKAAAGLVETWYTPVDEQDEEEATRTRFKLRPLNQLDLLQVISEGSGTEDGSFMPNHKGRMILLRRGVVDWEQFNNADGTPIKFTVANLDRVPSQILGELANEIMANSVITEDEKKS